MSVPRRVSDKWRRDGWPGLVLASLGRTVYRHVVLSESDLRDLPRVRADLEIEVRRLGREDVPAYTRSRRNPPDELLRRMARGSECYAAWHAGEIVSAAWWHPGEAWIEDLDRRLRLRSDELYAYDGWTAPMLRGRNITPLRNVLTQHALRDQGFLRAVTFSLPENRAIGSALAKMGWRRFGTAGVVRAGPARLEFVRAHGRIRWRVRRRRTGATDGELPPSEPGFLLGSS